MELKNLKITIEIENLNCEDETSLRELTTALDELNGLNRKSKGEILTPSYLLNMAKRRLDKSSKDGMAAILKAFDHVFKTINEPRQTLWVFEGPKGSGKDTLVNEILEELGSLIAVDLRDINEKSSFKFSKCGKNTKLVILRDYEIPFDEDGNLNLNIKVEKKGFEPFEISPDLLILTERKDHYLDRANLIYSFPNEQKESLKNNIIESVLSKK